MTDNELISLCNAGIASIKSKSNVKVYDSYWKRIRAIPRCQTEFEKEKIKSIYKKAKEKQKKERKVYHVDHIYPINHKDF